MEPARADAAGVIVDARDYYCSFYGAALAARRYILMSGWQFDSAVEILRGEDRRMAAEAGGHTKLLPFLNHLCETRPELEVVILAWDFHVAFALEREWMQRLLFKWRAHERLRFHFDAFHPEGGCHHQKFVVIDGCLSYVGGMDICEARWDDRSHRVDNPVRLSRKRPQKPYHDVQVQLLGREVAAPLVALFRDRWHRAGGGPLRFPDVVESAAPVALMEGALPLPAGTVAFTRTDPNDPAGPVRQVAESLKEAIDRAERLIYIETQYFSSREIREALERRMRAQGRTPLQIVVLVNARAEAFKEQIAVGLRQTENLVWLGRVAHETGHSWGCYFTLADGTPESRTYIHTKLFIVDDELLNVGSANLTNRSMGLDTELNLVWDVRGHEAGERVARAIKDVRVSLLAEHAGVSDPKILTTIDGLVERLDALAKRTDSRLRRHPAPTPGERDAIAIVDPQQLPFDPAGPDEPEDLWEHRSLFRGGVRSALASLAARTHLASTPEGHPMSAIDMLESQHREVEDIFTELEEAEKPAEKRRLFEMLADKLAVHATIEEKHFYPAIKAKRTEDILLEALEEHLTIKRAIADLLEVDAEDETFDAKITVLQELVEHHVEEEEEDLFPKVSKLLDAETLDALEQEMTATQEDLLAKGNPRNRVPSETREAAPL